MGLLLLFMIPRSFDVNQHTQIKMTWHAFGYEIFVSIPILFFQLSNNCIREKEELDEK